MHPCLPVLSALSSRAPGRGKTCQSLWPQWPPRTRLTRFGSEPFLVFSLSDVDGFAWCCVCLFACVFMETAIPLRYITELLWYRIRPEGENWSGCPAGIYWCSVARVISRTLLSYLRAKKLKRAYCRCSSVSCSCVLWDKTHCSDWDRTKTQWQNFARHIWESVLSEIRVGLGRDWILSEGFVTGPVGELALVTLGNRMGHCMGLRIGYSMSTV